MNTSKMKSLLLISSYGLLIEHFFKYLPVVDDLGSYFQILHTYQEFLMSSSEDNKYSGFGSNSDSGSVLLATVPDPVITATMIVT